MADAAGASGHLRVLIGCSRFPPEPYYSDMRHLSRLAVSALLAGCASSARGPTVVTSPSAVATSASPATFVRSTAESRTTRVIDVREGLSHQQAMRLLADALGQRYTVEVQDPRAGFAMTAWQATLVHEGVPDLRYRSRITARFLGEDSRRLQLHGEANWARGDEWDVGYDSAQLDSAAADLRAKLGRRP
jgi:hypothetical protein